MGCFNLHDLEVLSGEYAIYRQFIGPREIRRILEVRGEELRSLDEVREFIEREYFGKSGTANYVPVSDLQLKLFSEVHTPSNGYEFKGTGI